MQVYVCRGFVLFLFLFSPHLCGNYQLIKLFLAASVLVLCLYRTLPLSLENSIIETVLGCFWSSLEVWYILYGFVYTDLFCQGDRRINMLQIIFSLK